MEELPVGLMAGVGNAAPDHGGQAAFAQQGGHGAAADAHGAGFHSIDAGHGRAQGRDHRLTTGAAVAGCHCTVSTNPHPVARAYLRSRGLQPGQHGLGVYLGQQAAVQIKDVAARHSIDIINIGLVLAGHGRWKKAV